MYPRGMNHADIINKWAALADFAEDMAVEYGTAKAMRRRGSIPGEYWADVVEKAAARGLSDVTYEGLAAGAALARRMRRPSGLTDSPADSTESPSLDCTGGASRPTTGPASSSSRSPSEEAA